MEMGQFCRIKNTTIFGTYAGLVKQDCDRWSWFFDEEIGQMKKIQTDKLLPMERYK